MLPEPGIVSELARIAFSLDSQPVKIRAIQDVKAIPAGTSKVGPFRKGNSYVIPSWQANLLREFNFIELEDAPPIESAEIRKQVASESTSQKLSGFQKDFYLLARCEEDVLSAQVKASLKPKDAPVRFHAYLGELLHTRLSKLLKLATSPQSKNALQELPEEEQILLNRLTSLITQWKAFILRQD